MNKRDQRINRALWKAYEEGKITQQEIFNQRFTQLFELLHCSADGIEAGELYHSYLDQGHEILPEAKEVLATLHKEGYSLLAATNGIEKTQIQRLKAAEVYTYFSGMYASQAVGFQKPDQRFFDYILQHEGIQAQQCIMVGDTPSADIVGGKQAGMHTVFYDWKGLTSPVAPDYTIHHLLELLPLVHKIAAK